MTDQNAINIVNELKKIAASLDIIARYIQKLETRLRYDPDSAEEVAVTSEIGRDGRIALTASIALTTSN
jgi:hypothetical protein